jgi:hypothetical protein
MLIADPMDAMQSAATANEQDRSISTCLMHHSRTFLERERAKDRPKNSCQKYALIDAFEWLSSRSTNGHHEVLLKDVIYSQPAEQKNLFAQERKCDNP